MRMQADIKIINLRKHLFSKGIVRGIPDVVK